MARTIRFQGERDIDKKISAFNKKSATAGLAQKYGCTIKIAGEPDHNFICTVEGGNEDSAIVAVRSILVQAGMTIL